MTHNIDGAKLTPKVINELIELQTKGSALIYREQIENIIDFLLECHILDDSHPAMILDFIINLREIESSLYHMLPEEDVTIVKKGGAK